MYIFYEETRMMGHQVVKKSDDTFSHFDTIADCDREAGGRIKMPWLVLNNVLQRTIILLHSSLYKFAMPL